MDVVNQNQPQAPPKTITGKPFAFWITLLVILLLGFGVTIAFEFHHHRKLLPICGIGIAATVCLIVLCAGLFYGQNWLEKNPKWPTEKVRMLLEFLSVAIVLGLHIELANLVERKSLYANGSFMLGASAILIPVRLGSPERPHFLLKAIVLQFLGMSISCFFNEGKFIHKFHVLKACMLLFVALEGLLLVLFLNFNLEDMDNAREALTRGGDDILEEAHRRAEGGGGAV